MVAGAVTLIAAARLSDGQAGIRIVAAVNEATAASRHEVPHPQPSPPPAHTPPPTYPLPHYLPTLPTTYSLFLTGHCEAAGCGQTLYLY